MDSRDLIKNIAERKIAYYMKNYKLERVQSVWLFLYSYFFVLICDSRQLNYHNSFDIQGMMIRNRKIIRIENFT